MTCHAIKTGLNRISIIYINCTFNSIFLWKGLSKDKLWSVSMLRRFAFSLDRVLDLTIEKITSRERIFSIVK